MFDRLRGIFGPLGVIRIKFVQIFFGKIGLQKFPYQADHAKRYRLTEILPRKFSTTAHKSISELSLVLHDPLESYSSPGVGLDHAPVWICMQLC